MSDSETHIRPFGRYDLIRQIAVGGMGEIYLARTRSQQGTAFEGVSKRIVIKKILPALANEDEFVTKFIDEATIVTQLTHGNIVPVFDMGQENGEYFIAMEFIPGRDLRDVVKRAQADAWAFPIPAVLFIIAEVCKGLSYAHRKKDPDGVDLGIIHRDISPSNVLVSTTGEIKIVDFGIAKAASKTSHSVTGRLQGKFSYMSPEQATGRYIDKRSDVFSTGVLFYELLTLKRPFDGQSDLETLDNIRSLAPRPPSALRPEITPAVDAMVMRALSKDPADRHQTIDELEREAMQCLYAESNGYNGPELAETLHVLFPDGLEREETRGSASGLTPVAGRRSVEDLMEAELHKLLSAPSSGGPPQHNLASSAFTATSTIAPQGSAAPPLSQPTPARRSDGKLETVSIVAPSLSETPLVSKHISDTRIRVNDPLDIAVSPTADDIPAYQPPVVIGTAATIDLPALRPEDYPDRTPPDITPLPAPDPVTDLTTHPQAQIAPESTIAPSQTSSSDLPQAPDRDLETAAVSAQTQPSHEPAPHSSKTRLVLFATLAMLVVVLGAWAYSVFFTPPTLIVVSGSDETRISLDGKPLGVGKKLKVKDLDPGTYQLTADRAGFISKNIPIQLSSGEETVVSIRLEAQETPVPTLLVPFSSKPPGALIYLDGKPTGLKTQEGELTPVPVPSDVREHTVVLKILDPKTDQVLGETAYTLRPGEINASYAHVFRDLLPKDPPANNGNTPVANVTTTNTTSSETTSAPPEKKKRVTLQVNATPSDARINVKGGNARPIAQHRYEVDHGSRVRVGASKKGYKDSSKSVYMRVRGLNTVSLTLEKSEEEKSPETSAQTYPVRITAVDGTGGPPVTSNFWIDGKPCPNAGTFGCSVRLSAGQHSVRATSTSDSSMKGQRSCVVKESSTQCIVRLRYTGN